jgi:hypothetical protein
MQVGVPTVIKNEVKKLFAAYTSFIPFLSVHVESVILIFKLIADGDDIPEHLPIHANAMCSPDRIVSLLSAFGNMVPSFMITGGKKQLLNNSDNVPTSLAAVKVPIETGASDVRNMIEKHYILVPAQGQQNGRIQKSMFKSNDKTRIYAMLMASYGKSQTSQSATFQQQSSAALDDDDEWLNSL